MGFVRIYRNESPRTRAVKQQIASYKPGTRTLAAPVQIRRGSNATGTSEQQRSQPVTRQPTQQPRGKLAAGVIDALRRQKAQSAPKSPSRTFAKKRQPNALDDLMGCDELGCMLDDCSLEDSMDEELGNFLDDAIGTLKKGAKWLVDAFDSLNSNPAFMAVFPVVALANSDVGMSVGSSLPGIGGVVSLGQSVKSWAQGSNVTLPPAVANWAGQAAAGATTLIPPEVTSWAKNAIPPSVVAEAKKAGVDLTAITKAPSKGVDGASRWPKLLMQPIQKQNAMFAKLGAVMTEAGNKALLEAAASPASAVAITPEQLALAAPVPMPTVAARAPSVNVSVGPLSGEMAQVAARIEQSLGANLSQIQAQLKLRSLQDQATSEHRALMKEAKFKRQLLGGLTQIADNTKR